MKFLRNAVLSALALVALAGIVHADVSLVQAILSAPADLTPAAGDLLPIESAGTLKSVSVYALNHTGVASFNGRVGNVTLTGGDLGALLTFGCPTHQWVNSLNVAGTFACGQPGFADLSGQVAPSQLPAATPTSLGGIEAVAAIMHQVVQYIDNTGVPHLVQLAFSDIGGTLPNSQLAMAPANTLKGNPTSAAASEQDVAVPSCDGASNALTWTGGSGFGCQTIAGENPTAPTVTVLTTGGGTYTTPVGVKWLQIRMIGGGGGGAGGGSTSGNGGAGGTTTFGSSLLTANGGTGGAYSDGGSGGTSSGGYLDLTGASGGQDGPVSVASVGGGAGAGTPFGSGGRGGGSSSGGEQGLVPGAGGGGAGATAIPTDAGQGGGAGGYLEAVISSPAASYSYAVGAGGTAGTAGSGTGAAPGGAGLHGIIIIVEHYNY